ncbi:MAG: zf-HC2 domain-containing protein [Candidatus Eremiobacteraeota bacterium]|nr:zf-HC2 domain-containing protein [Candidatus Eremiobacteraeota bacterium]
MMTHLTHEKLIDYLHDALSPEEDALIYAHIDACSECRSAYLAETQISELLRREAAADERELPSIVKARIWETVRNSAPTPLERVRALFRPAYALAAAALVAALVLIPVTLHNGVASPSIDAAYYFADHAAMNGTIPFADRGSAASAQFETIPASDQTAVVAVPVVYTADAR